MCSLPCGAQRAQLTQKQHTPLSCLGRALAAASRTGSRDAPRLIGFLRVHVRVFVRVRVRERAQVRTGSLSGASLWQHNIPVADVAALVPSCESMLLFGHTISAVHHPAAPARALPMIVGFAPQAILRKHMGDTSQRSTQRTRQRILEEACTPNRYDSRTQAMTATTHPKHARVRPQTHAGLTSDTSGRHQSNPGGAPFTYDGFNSNDEGATKQTVQRSV